MKTEMKPIVIKAFDLPSLWYSVIRECMERGYERPVFRGARVEQRRKELDFVTLICTNPGMRPLVPDTPEGIPPPTSMDYVNKYVFYLVSDEKSPDEDYTYGERLMKIHIDPVMDNIDKLEGSRLSSVAFNQIRHVIQMLKETPETNRGMLIIVRPSDYVELEHPPCLTLMQAKVRYGKLHLYAYFRSWDAWGGLPNNLAAIQLMKEHFAKEIGVKDGPLFASSMGLHVYSGEWPYAEQLIHRATGKQIDIKPGGQEIE